MVETNRRLVSVTSRMVIAIRWASLGLLATGAVLWMRALPAERLLNLVQTWIDGLGVWGPIALGAIYIVSAPALRQAIARGRVPRVRWLDYDWRLNSRANRKASSDGGS